MKTWQQFWHLFRGVFSDVCSTAKFLTFTLNDDDSGDIVISNTENRFQKFLALIEVENIEWSGVEDDAGNRSFFDAFISDMNGHYLPFNDLQIQEFFAPDLRPFLLGHPRSERVFAEVLARVRVRLEDRDLLHPGYCV